MKSGVDVIQQPVPDINCCFRSFRNQRPEIELLPILFLIIVIAKKSIKCAQPHPSSTESFPRILLKSADIGADNGDLEERGEL
jgi:hypothetical protein